MSYITKLALRVSNKFSFIRNKKIDYLEKESTKIAEESFQKKEIRLTYDKLPEKGIPKDELIAILDKRIKADIDPKAGQTFAYVYDYDKEHT
jgi:hypothetical protein